MTGTMIERVARALADEKHGAGKWQWLSNGEQSEFCRLARTAIEAMGLNSEPVAFAEAYSGRVVSVSMSEGRHHTVPLYAVLQEAAK